MVDIKAQRVTGDFSLTFNTQILMSQCITQNSQLESLPQKRITHDLLQIVYKEQLNIIRSSLTSNFILQVQRSALVSVSAPGASPISDIGDVGDLGDSRPSSAGDKEEPSQGECQVFKSFIHKSQKQWFNHQVGTCPQMC